MSRARLIPSLVRRSKGLVEMTISNASCGTFKSIEFHMASNLNDAYTAPLLAFTVEVGKIFRSPSAHILKRQVEQSELDITRVLFDPSEYSTPFVPNTARIPADFESNFIVLRGVFEDGTTGDFGPITALPPYDFFSTSNPTFTCSGNAPDLQTNGVIPDVLGEGCVNLHLPMYSQSVQVTNLGQNTLFLSFHPGMSPSILRAGESTGLTGAGVPEFFLGSDGGSPLVTMRVSTVNRG